MSLVLESVPEHETACVADFWALLKPRVMSLVVFTGWAGLALAPGQMHWFLAAVAVLCIALASGAAGCLNMWWERETDALMPRTAGRPLPQGRVAPEDARDFGMFLLGSSVAMMGLAVNWLAAFWLGFAAFFYVVIYTMWLKPRTPQNIVIGGAAGAFPPMIGWAAATGQTPVMAWVLFLVIFLWTPPHFWALALNKSDDYAKAGIPMLPVVAGARETKRQIFLYSMLLLPCVLLPTALGATGLGYAIGAAILTLGLIGQSVLVLRAESQNRTPAWRLFAYSIVYLFAIFGMMVLDKV